MVAFPSVLLSAWLRCPGWNIWTQGDKTIKMSNDQPTTNVESVRAMTTDDFEYPRRQKWTEQVYIVGKHYNNPLPPVAEEDTCRQVKTETGSRGPSNSSRIFSASGTMNTSNVSEDKCERLRNETGSRGPSTLSRIFHISSMIDNEPLTTTNKFKGLLATEKLKVLPPVSEKLSHVEPKPSAKSRLRKQRSTFDLKNDLALISEVPYEKEANKDEENLFKKLGDSLAFCDCIELNQNNAAKAITVIVLVLTLVLVITVVIQFLK
ncbi:uncharacterized protein LOC111088818 [Limulus polyphemus]|uniref:Uncharacterized protein LOC111088818 n=1 Tax=Limulus polyphemus TaxID=6850 RepID=A0ABM1TI85_LIMPO|nr:uncharacterized protein LOC111088818 [Limulus polyphemus]